MLAQNIPSNPADGHAEVALWSQILGGASSASLPRLRDQSGYTYGVHSSVSLLRHGAHFVLSSFVDNAHVETAVADIFEVLRKASASAPSARDLERARLGMRNDPQFRFRGPSDLVARCGWAFITQESLEALQSRYLGGPSAALRALDPRYAPNADEAALVLLGDAEVLRPIVARLGRTVPVVVGGEF